MSTNYRLDQFAARLWLAGLAMRTWPAACALYVVLFTLGLALYLGTIGPLLFVAKPLLLIVVPTLFIGVSLGRSAEQMHYPVEEVVQKLIVFQDSVQVVRGMSLAPGGMRIEDHATTMKTVSTCVAFPISLALNLCALSVSLFYFLSSSFTITPRYGVCAVEALLLISYVVSCVLYWSLAQPIAALRELTCLRGISALRLMSVLHPTVFVIWCNDLGNMITRARRAGNIRHAYLACFVMILLMIAGAFVACSIFVEKIAELGLQDLKANWTAADLSWLSIFRVGAFVNQMLHLHDVDGLFYQRSELATFARRGGKMSVPESELSQQVLGKSLQRIWHMNNASIWEKVVAIISFGGEDLQNMSITCEDEEARLQDWQLAAYDYETAADAGSAPQWLAWLFRRGPSESKEKAEAVRGSEDTPLMSAGEEGPSLFSESERASPSVPPRRDVAMGQTISAFDD